MGEHFTEQLNKWKDAAIQGSASLIKYAILAAVVITVVYVILKVLKIKKPKQAVESSPDMGISVNDLMPQGPPPAGPQLAFYNVPVRLLAVVIAPAGRGHDLPPLNQLAGVLDAIVPGLALVVTAHKPVVRKWSPQLSSIGFANVFFTGARLPGEGGKGTLGCAVAGVFKVGKMPVMAGLVMRTASPTNFGHVVLQHETQWRDVLRTQ